MGPTATFIDWVGGTPSLGVIVVSPRDRPSLGSPQQGRVDRLGAIELLVVGDEESDKDGRKDEAWPCFLSLWSTSSNLYPKHLILLDLW